MTLRKRRSSPTPTDEEVRPARVRLAPADRERQILDGAIAYFAEVGFTGQTRELSKRLGITQPLLYRYFESKQVLVERVYETVFEGRWNPAWIPLLEDRSTPLRARLLAFYDAYATATYQPDWIRIYMFAGLSRPELNRRYLRRVRGQLMPVFCRELRHECGLADHGAPVSEEEIEYVWNLHGGIFYSAIRQHVYQTRINVDFMTRIGFVIDGFLAGARAVYPGLVERYAPEALALAASPSRPR